MVSEGVRDFLTGRRASGAGEGEKTLFIGQCSRNYFSRLVFPSLQGTSVCYISRLLTVDNFSYA